MSVLFGNKPVIRLKLMHLKMSHRISLNQIIGRWGKHFQKLQFHWWQIQKQKCSWKIWQFCFKASNKIIKRHQLLSSTQGCLIIDQYIRTLHKLARQCSKLGGTYDDFVLEALRLGINGKRLRRMLFEESEELSLKQATKNLNLQNILMQISKW